MKAATMSTAINYFKKTSIFSFNPDIFEDSDFMPAGTNIPRTGMPSPVIMPLNSIPRSLDPLIELLQNIPNTVEDILNANIDFDSMHPSFSYRSQTNKLNKTTFEIKKVSTKDLMLIPQGSNEENCITKIKSTNRGKAVILTESPYKNKLEKKPVTYLW